MEHECKICGKIFETGAKLGGHVSSHSRVEKIKEPIIHQCRKCKQIFDNGMALGGHINHCGKSFSEFGIEKKRQTLFAEANYSCIQCGESRRRPCGGIILEIDHIDGNHKNNSKENLRVLCPNCHALTPNFRNWGNKKNSIRVSTRQYRRDAYHNKVNNDPGPKDGSAPSSSRYK